MGQYNLFRTQLDTTLTAHTGGFLGISGSAAGSSAGVYNLTVLSVSGTTATVRSVLTLHAAGQTTTVTDALPFDSQVTSPLVPGVTLITGTLAVGDTATIAVELSPNALLITPAYFQYTLPAGGTQLQATFDLASLGTNLTNLSFNFITSTQKIYDSAVPKPDGWAYDGLGRIGNDAVRLNDPRQFLSFSNVQSQPDVREGPNDLQGSPATITAGQGNAIDIVDWSLDVRRLQ
jgi:hypothetical protein